MAYGSTPYIGMALKKMASTLKVHKGHTWNVCVRLVKGLHEPYQTLPSAFMDNGTVNFAGEHHSSLKYQTGKSLNWANRLSSDFLSQATR